MAHRIKKEQNYRGQELLYDAEEPELPHAAYAEGVQKRDNLAPEIQSESSRDPR